MSKPERAAESLATRIQALSRAADLAAGRLSDDVVDQARRATRKADRRLAIAGDTTVIALAGATGSGKSSLFNAISGTRLAEPGLKRPTTNRSMAAYWGAQLPHELLDWLDVPRRHLVQGDDPVLNGLVLIDLPDHDSTVAAHRAEADRLVELVDMLVWVVDPQKYADATLHNDYLKPLADHAGVMLVVLNQADRLTGDQLRETMRDLRGLLDSEGLSKTTCVAASALTGMGIETLRKTIATTVREKKTAANRLSSDISSVAHSMKTEFGDAKVPTKVPEARARELNKALAEAAGASIVRDAVLKSMRHRGGLATGWPVTKWLRRFTPDPLRMLHLDRAVPRGKKRPDELEPASVQRTSLPTAGGVQTARVDIALRGLAASSSQGLPDGFATAVREATLAHRNDLPDELDRAVGATDLAMERGQGWWTVVQVLQWIIFVAAVVGAGWLLLDLVLNYLQLPQLPVVRVGRAPLPTVMLLGGALLGMLVSLISRAGVELDARAKGARAERALTRSIVDVADRLVISPVNGELTRFNQGRQEASRAIG